MLGGSLVTELVRYASVAALPSASTDHYHGFRFSLEHRSMLSCHMLASVSPEMNVMHSMHIKARFVGTPAHSTSPLQEPQVFCSTSKVSSGATARLYGKMEHYIQASIPAKLTCGRQWWN